MAQVNVRRLKVDCAVPRNHPNPLAVRTRLDEAAERLPSALGELLAPLEQLDDEVIVIRRLELTFDLDTSLAPADLARAWAARLAIAVAEALRPDGREAALRFETQAHYLARFLADTVTGRAVSTWYYRRWSGIGVLEIAAQLRTALVEEPARGVAALGVLSRSELTSVLSALGAREAQRVAEAAIAAGSDGDLDAVARVLAPFVPEWIRVAPSLPSAWQAALALVARAAEALQRAELRSAVVLAAALAATRHRAHVEHVTPSPAAILAVADLPAVEPLLAVSADVRRELLAAAGAVESVSRAPVHEGWYTRLGGLLLLLPRIEELSLDELFGADAGRARLAVLSRTAGHDRRAEVLSNPLWRHLCGVAPDVDVEEWMRTDGVADRLAQNMWQRGAARAERIEVIATRYERPLVVVASAPDSEWLAVAPLTPELRALLRGSSPVDYGGVDVTVQIAHAPARSAAHALAWIGPADASQAELAFTVAAQQVLRAFARRLPGFASSSLKFLHDSFLDFDATVLETEGTFHCRVGRPRLAAVFGLTGALRGRLSIGDGRVLELYPEA